MRKGSRKSGGEIKWTVPNFKEERRDERRDLKGEKDGERDR